MINLVPSYTYDYEQLWKLVAVRNRWFIKTRFVVCFVLFVFVFSLNNILGLNFPSYQITSLVIIALAILIYNLLFFFIEKSALITNEPEKFNQLHFSFLQMLCDLIALGFLVYYTGGIESPFVIFFVFHMIIGSMVLPGYLIYSIAALTVIFVSVFSLLEFSGIIPHIGFGTLLEKPVYNNFIFIVISSSSYGIMVMVSVFLANNIAGSHYRREQELKVALEKLGEAEFVKQKYIMGIVHEIKSPVVAIQSNLDLILKDYLGPVSEKVKEKLARARSRSEEAVQIINDVLNISRIKVLGKVNLGRIDPVEIIRTVLAKRTSQLEFAKLTVVFVDKRERVSSLLLDRNLLEIAFSNLISNAIKYNIPGGKVEITAFEVRGSGVAVEICDDGIGVPPGEQGSVFKEFYRASNAKGVETEGSGLGLSVVKQIVEQHGGNITLGSPSRLSRGSSRPGTVFTVLFPFLSDN